jgi:hypothetical protein
MKTIQMRRRVCNLGGFNAHCFGRPPFTEIKTTASDFNTLDEKQVLLFLYLFVIPYSSDRASLTSQRLFEFGFRLFCHLAILMNVLWNVNNSQQADICHLIYKTIICYDMQRAKIVKL